MNSLSAPELASLDYTKRKLICSHPRSFRGRFESFGRKNPILCLGEERQQEVKGLDEKYIELPEAPLACLPAYQGSTSSSSKWNAGKV